MDTPAAWHAMPVPERIRTIFTRWADPCDPALAPGTDRAVVLNMYHALSGQRAGLGLTPAALARIAADARHNQHFGQFAELRREGEQVMRWVCAVLAAGPAPRHIFIPF